MPRHRAPLRSAPAWRAPRRAVLAVLAAATACGAGEAARPSDDVSAGASAVPATAAGTVATAGDAGEVELTLGSGPFAGTHKATGDMSCFAQPGIWGASHENQLPRGLTGMLLLLHGVPASGGSSKQFNFNLVFGQADGPLGTNGTLGLNTAEGAGTGTATVERDGKRATIRIEGTTSYGAKLTAVVRCATVDVVD